jgi:hypothetical protein
MAATTDPSPKCRTCWLMRGIWAQADQPRDVDPRAAAWRRLVASKACLGTGAGQCPLG